MLPFKKKEKDLQNVFLDIDLEPRKGKRYPAFNFVDCVNEQKRRMNHQFSDVEEDELSHLDDSFSNDVIKRIEQRYAKTTNTKEGKVKRRRQKKPNPEEEYDLDDAFVDDSEFQREELPETMHTLKGGYYINRGPLKLRHGPTIPAAPVAPVIDDPESDVTNDVPEKRHSSPMGPRRRKRRDGRAPAIPGMQRDGRAPAIPGMKRLAHSKG